MRILHVAAEAAPLIKTGGLADVLGALPAAQSGPDTEVRLLLPGYPGVLDALAAGADGARPTALATFVAPHGGGLTRLLAARCGPVGLYVLDSPWLYRRAGNPYLQADGTAWPDNHLRFGLLCWAGAQLAAGGLDPGWQPDVVHAHDWHAGLVPWLLRRHPAADVPCAFSVHNIGYQGLFPAAAVEELGLPRADWHPDRLEFHGELSFLKAGLLAASGVGTVSPTHAREILSPATGHGLDGVIRSRRERPVGILNGIDTRLWDPARDPALAARFDATDLAARDANRAALVEATGLAAPAAATGRLLLGMVSRLTDQKGTDLVIAQLPAMIAAGCDLVVLGSGERRLEAELAALAARHPRHVAVRIGFDEALAHQVFAGVDAILVPSRYEPCGLTQMYAMRYGALPIVHRTGGLADTVDARCGFSFAEPTGAALLEAVRQARDAYADRARWRRLMRAAMAIDFSWDKAAREYLGWYAALGAQAGRNLPSTGG